jgi:hypothetical protein
MKAKIPLIAISLLILSYLFRTQIAAATWASDSYFQQATRDAIRNSPRVTVRMIDRDALLYGLEKPGHRDVSPIAGMPLLSKNVVELNSADRRALADDLYRTSHASEQVTFNGFIPKYCISVLTPDSEGFDIILSDTASTARVYTSRVRFSTFYLKRLPKLLERS